MLLFKKNGDCEIEECKPRAVESILLQIDRKDWKNVDLTKISEEVIFDAIITKPKWVQAVDGQPINSKLPENICTSYLHNTDELNIIFKSLKNEYPIRHCPINRLKTYENTLKSVDENKIEELSKKFHAGEKLPIARMTDSYFILDASIAKFAWNTGLSHIPVIILGEDKKKVEDELKETIILNKSSMLLEGRVQA